MKKIKMIIAGIVSGFLNGLFGSGGGVLAVMFLRGLIGDEKKLTQARPLWCCL